MKLSAFIVHCKEKLKNKGGTHFLSQHEALKLILAVELLETTVIEIAGGPLGETKETRIMAMHEAQRELERALDH